LMSRLYELLIIEKRMHASHEYASPARQDAQ
jgi:hypothetical protein